MIKYINGIVSHFTTHTGVRLTNVDHLGTLHFDVNDESVYLLELLGNLHCYRYTERAELVFSLHGKARLTAGITTKLALLLWYATIDAYLGERPVDKSVRMALAECIANGEPKLDYSSMLTRVMHWRYPVKPPVEMEDVIAEYEIVLSEAKEYLELIKELSCTS